MNEIRFEDALKLIESGATVKIQYVSLDIRRKTGGKVKEFVGVVTKPKEQRKTNQSIVSTGKARNHYSNFTRNFFTVLNDRITMDQKTVHLPLILEVNGQKMML